MVHHHSAVFRSFTVHMLKRPEAKQCRQLSNGVQVQRLIAVLSVPGVSRRKVLEGSSLDPGPDLTDQERKQLEAAGWTPGTTIRSLLNFTGLSLSHQAYVSWCTNSAFSVVWLALLLHFLIDQPGVTTWRSKLCTQRQILLQ